MTFKIVLTLLFMINTIDHLVATKTVFTKPQGGKTLLVVVVFTLFFCSIALIGMTVFFSSPNLINTILGLTLMLLSTFLIFNAKKTVIEHRLSPICSTDLPNQLIRSGPYRYIRHPFYSAYMLNYLGLAIGSNNIFTLAVMLIVLFIYSRASIHEESKFNASELSEAYNVYKRKTGRFLPTLNVFFTNGSKEIAD